MLLFVLKICLLDEISINFKLILIHELINQVEPCAFQSIIKKDLRMRYVKKLGQTPTDLGVYVYRMFLKRLG